MKRYELTEEIALAKAAIIARLEYLGIKSSIKTLKNGQKISSNPMLGSIIETYNMNFYDHKTKDIKQHFDIENYSLCDIMSKTHLKYFLSALEQIEEYLKSVEYIYNKSDKDAIKIKMQIIAKQQREAFKKEKKNIPITNLSNENSLSTLATMLKEKLKNFDEEKTEDELKKEIKEMSDYLRNTIPKKFNNEKAYGTIIGNLNSGFYSLKGHEIIDYLRKKDVTVPDGNILNIMDKEQLKYRYVCLQFIGRYSQRYDKHSFEKFKTRAIEIGGIARSIYIKESNKEPLYELKGKPKIKNMKANEKINKKASLQKESETIITEQLDMFSQIEKATKKI